ncbi:aspartate ammonia-lyase [Bifidobacterium pullorum subsp. saeculare]|uniref:Aspartate ammonia-lyase n=1 Tax=Bifidobacterium pullorum subsp. saeculare TaxID=78257 RepID=A0A939B973_9BIFI|nr:aspartate ammonia-lyase [Bifidobacterium pullorum subsp. saeculare]
MHTARTAAASSPATRLEHDCIGSLEVPADAYWGIHTQRAIGNFPVSGVTDGDHPTLIRSYATVKRACAAANAELGLVDAHKAELIERACRDIEGGGLADQFPVDVLQGGAGTSANMNMNEVIANRALELAGRARGDYTYIHPNDTVNHSQSTNDTYPAACKLAIVRSLEPLRQSTDRLRRALHGLADRHENDIKLGRTQLQDAVPMTFGQEFHAFASFLKIDMAAMDALIPDLCVLNLGATAIGTGICADLRFRKAAAAQLKAITGLPVTIAPDPLAAMTDMSAYIAASATMKNLAIHLKKLADDLRLLNSGPRAGFGDLRLPARQAGSSIMPAKVNPVIPECVDQCCFTIFGMDVTVNWAAAEGQLQLNAFDPIIVHQILTGMWLMTNAMDMLRVNCIEAISVDKETGREHALRSPAISAALNDAIGYEAASAIAAEAVATGRTVREVAGERTDLPAAELDRLLDPVRLSRRLGQTCRERQHPVDGTD